MNYIIEYTVQSLGGAVLKSGKMKAKNRLSAFDARCKFGDFVKRKYPYCGQLIIHSCREDSLWGGLSDIFGDTFMGMDIFGDNFKK